LCIHNPYFCAYYQDTDSIQLEDKTMSNKIALVTGSSRGLGKSTAVNLAKKGVDVIVTYHNNAAEAAKVVAEIESLGAKAVALQLDTANTKTFADFAVQVKQSLQEKWQVDRFDFLVNNAGTGAYASFADTTEEDFDHLLNIHVKGVFFLTQKLLPLINDGGRIVNLSTGLTRIILPGYAAYASMKGAIETLTLYMAKELGARKIAVNVVAPGAIETDFGGGAVRDNSELNQYLASQTALGRVGLPDDIGGAIASLLSEDNQWVNAQRIEVSGGQSI
jgi:NAD(P)-dependent dehydrogenase (short-subunit alcohol dehydrogenase family)